MMGVPDAVGEMAAAQKHYYEKIPEIIRDAIDLLRTDPEMFLLKQAMGVAWDILSNPAVHFDKVMSGPPGETTTLRAFNSDVLKIRDAGYTTNETYDWRSIPAMVNTVTMTKLSWLSPAGLRTLIRDLEAAEMRYTPMLIDGMDNVAEIAAGMGHVLVLKGDGTVWAWGQNRVGEVGDGTNEARSRPVQVPRLKDIVAVSASTWLDFSIRCRYIRKDEYDRLSEIYEHIAAQLVKMSEQPEDWVVPSPLLDSDSCGLSRPQTVAPSVAGRRKREHTA